MTRVNAEFPKTFDATGEFDAAPCMNCGTCTALCPMELTSLPRELFRYAQLGMADKIGQHAETVFSCLLCRMCEVNCPSQVKIAGNVRALRAYLNRKEGV
ncbi:MAG: 4Fe-4S dicluster domain-containing protein [candidate division FCPU426 bacterium]